MAGCTDLLPVEGEAGEIFQQVIGFRPVCPGGEQVGPPGMLHGDVVGITDLLPGGIQGCFGIQNETVEIEDDGCQCVVLLSE